MKTIYKVYKGTRPGSVKHKAAKTHLKRITRQSKRAHWGRIIADASASKNIWAIAKWRKAIDRFQSPPPFIDGERSISDLRDKLLKRKTAEEGVPDPWAEDLPINKSIYWDTMVTEAEAKKATTGSNNTAPGADGISVALLQLGWPAIVARVAGLVRGRLQASYHPLPFRSAEIIILKPGKLEKAYTAHKGCRPISLLSCIGKGLEKAAYLQSLPSRA